MRYFRSRDDDQLPADVTTLRHELDEAEQTIRSLTRQISREQSLCTEIAQSYKQVVANLVEVSRENADLERQRDMWRQRVEQKLGPGGEGPEVLRMTSAEIRAIRKAIARLHHPDTGGDPERMKQWNAVLDQLEG